MSKVKNAAPVGGQALIEGVMMKGPRALASAIRAPGGEIIKRSRELHPIKEKYPVLGWPFIRGAVNFIEMMSVGYKELMYSAEVSGEEIEEEPTKFEKWLSHVFKKDIMDIVVGFAMVLGVALALGLFVLLPTFLTGLTGGLLPASWKTVAEAIIKLSLFVGYVLLVSRVKEIRRVFEYHGAEHKTIRCYEAGELLTAENAKKHTRYHPRCGTNFISIVLLISILIFSFVSWNSVIIRVLLKLLLLPVVVGVSYEIIRLAGKYDNFLTRAVSLPGMLMQKLTTREPDDSQLEVAIEALKLALPQESAEDRG